MQFRGGLVAVSGDAGHPQPGLLAPNLPRLGGRLPPFPGSLIPAELWWAGHQVAPAALLGANRRQPRPTCPQTFPPLPYLKTTSASQLHALPGPLGWEALDPHQEASGDGQVFGGTDGLWLTGAWEEPVEVRRQGVGGQDGPGRGGARRCSPRYWPLPSRNGGPTGPLCMGCTYCAGGYPAAPAAPPLAAALGQHPSSSHSSSRGGGSEDRGVKTPRMASAGVLRGGKREAIRPAHGWFGTRPRSSQKDENLVIVHKQFSTSQSLQKLLLNLS